MKVIKLLMGTLVIFFTFHPATPIVAQAQESIQSQKEEKITEKQLGDTETTITKNRGKNDKSDRGGQSPQDSQKTAGGADVVAAARSTYPRRQF